MGTIDTNPLLFYNYNFVVSSVVTFRNSRQKIPNVGHTQTRPPGKAVTRVCPYHGVRSQIRHLTMPILKAPAPDPMYCLCYLSCQAKV